MIGGSQRTLRELEATTDVERNKLPNEHEGYGPEADGKGAGHDVISYRHSGRPSGVPDKCEDGDA